MIKKLKQVMQANPSVPYIKAGKEKEFAGKHKVLKTDDAAGNDEKVFKGKGGVAPRRGGGKSPESSPKDSYGEGRIALKVSPDNSEDEYGGHDEETVNEISDKLITKYSDKAFAKMYDTPDQKGKTKRFKQGASGTARLAKKYGWPNVSDVMAKARKEETELDERAYDKHAVNKEIRKDKRIGGKEAKLIHRLLRGRTTDSKQDHSMGSIIRKEETELDEVSIDKATNYINKSIGKLSSTPNVKNRVAGISRASGKVALAQGILTPSALKTKVKASEEIEIDEKDHGATHQLRIARKTLLMPDAMAGVMGGMNKREAAEIIRRSRQRLKRNEPTVMTHEDTINELSNKLLKRYTKKAEPEAEGYGRPVQGYGHKSFKRMKGVSAAHEIMRDRKNPVRAKVHDVRHMSDGEIYDHTQTHDGIKDGDVLHMSKGRAGIMMKAWPTMHHGSSDALHSLKDGSSWDTSFRGRYKKSHEVAGNIKEDLDENHIHLTVSHESNTKPLFKAKASSDAEVRTKLESLKSNSKGYNYRVGVHNTKTGETWSGKPHSKFPGFGEEAAINELSSKVLHNYAQKSRQDAGRLQKAQSAAIKTGTDPDNVFTHKGFHKAANRGKGFDLAYKKFYAKANTERALKKEDLFIEQIPSIPPDQPIQSKPLKKASSIEGLARRGVKLRVAQKKHELLKKRII